MIKTTKQQLNNLIDSLNIKKKSLIVLHSSLFIFGRIENGPETILELLINKFCKEGTLILPSFTYSFRRKLIFNVNKSKCHPEIGLLSEILRKKVNVYRGLDPLFSFIACGQDKEIVRRVSNNCFGQKSVFENLFKKKGTILSLGVEMTHGITEFLHIENIANVPFRFKKKFEGITIDHNNNRKKDYVYHFAKDEKFFKNYRSNREIFEKKLIKKKICNKKKFGYGNIFTLDMENFLDYSANELKKNPYIMIEKI